MVFFINSKLMEIKVGCLTLFDILSVTDGEVVLNVDSYKNN